jgi:hypothetical protein
MVLQNNSFSSVSFGEAENWLAHRKCMQQKEKKLFGGFLNVQSVRTENGRCATNNFGMGSS